MTSGSLAINLLLALAAFGAVGLLFAWAAWRAARRFGTRGLVAAWALATLAVTALMAARIHQQHAALGFTPVQQNDALVFASFLPLWAAGHGGVALVVQRQVRVDGLAAPFTRRTAARSLGAFATGVLLFFLVYIVRGVAALLRRL